MLRDLVELRQNGWVPRKHVNNEGPEPIQQFRPDDEIIHSSFSNRHPRDQRNNDRDGDTWMSNMSMSNVNHNSPLIMNNIYYMNSGVGGMRDRDYRDGGNNMMGNGGNGGNGGGRNDMNSGYRHNSQRNNQNHNNHSNFSSYNRYNKHNIGQQNNSSHNSHNNPNNKQLPPRFNKNLMTTPPTENFDNVHLSPATNSLLYKGSVTLKSRQLPMSQQPRSNNATPNELFGSGGGGGGAAGGGPGLGGGGAGGGGNGGGGSIYNSPTSNNHLNSNAHNTPNLSNANSNSAANPPLVAPVPLIPAPQPVTNLLNKNQVLIKQASQEKPKQNKKDKGPTKDEVLKRVLAFVRDTILVASSDGGANMDAIVAAFIELKVPEKFMRDTVHTILIEIVDKNDQIHELVIDFLIALKKEGKLQNAALLDGFKALINGMSDSPVPRITTLVASLLCRAVIVKMFRLVDVANYTENGAHYPLFLLVLQLLHKSLGKQALLEIFSESKINLMSSLPEADRTKDRQAEILEDRNLSFLYPLLKLQGELQKQIQTDPNPQTLYKWIKDNVEPSCWTDNGFITALINVILKYVTQVSRHSTLSTRRNLIASLPHPLQKTTLAEGIDSTQSPDKMLIEQERALLIKYCPVLTAFLDGHGELQLAAIFAMQVFCYSLNFPKGMLLRLFNIFYDNNVIEEESYLRWKEDLSDVHPGKGNALFQVNAYLTYLETAEDEDDEEDE